MSPPQTLSVAGDLIGGDWLVMSEDLGDTYATPDTIATVDDSSFFCAGAVSPRRRWAVKADWRLGAERAGAGPVLGGGGGGGGARCCCGCTTCRGGLVGQREVTASGQGRDEVRFDSEALRRSLSSGVYFLAMTDAAGAESETTRIVVLR